MAASTAATGMSRAVKQGYDVGFHDCAAAMDGFVKFVHEDDAAYSHFGQWSVKNPNEETYSSLTSETYPDGKGLTSFETTKNARGKCSVTFTQVLLIPNTICAVLREGAFKTWKEYGELNGDKIYEDPSTPNASVVLTPIAQAGCMVLKHVVGFGLEPAEK
jgi:hypothetical protein